MNLRLTLLLSILFLSLWCATSCSKLEEEADTPPPTERPDDTTGDNDTTTSGDTLTVAQALKAEVGTWVIVKGFIVGYVDGTTMSKARFSVPTEKVNTNLIIADRADELDYKNCLPIQIKSGTDDQIAFSLLSHPDLLGKGVAIEGKLTTYFKVNGFKHPDFYLVELPEADFTDAPEEENPTPEPQPEPQPDATSDTPTLDFTPQANIYGR